MSVERPLASVPPPRPGHIILATLLFGSLLLLGAKLGIPATALAVAAGLWTPTCILLARLRG
ncbi:hypothetical protein BWI15_00290 [Kribbella sp. ALI-6-A]|uniref:hypothetical protein n=1 Tax=Kribbella sp. ALI-6-A TaxID=1933817 RepID=UPI00097BE2C5|nr:hypothetical protein [Kribbella sp. ALI-6-A]ONI79051.1 hypothetical protein BWI15_00290 [Kribbella sp. ALI-6-A]